MVRAFGQSQKLDWSMSQGLRGLLFVVNETPHICELRANMGHLRVKKKTSRKGSFVERQRAHS